MRLAKLAALFLCPFAFFLCLGADRQILNRGDNPGDGTGDSRWIYIGKANANFEELFSRTGSSGVSNSTAIGSLSLSHVRTNSGAWLAALASNLYTNIAANNLTAGVDFDVFTVPAGYRAIPTFTHSTTNTSGAASIAYKVKISGSYYLLVTGTAQTNIANAIATTFVFEPGDIIAVNPTLTGVNTLVSLTLIPETYPLKAPRITSFVVGSNHVYTVPSGKVAVNPLRSELVTAGITSISPVISQSSGGALQYQSYLNSVRLGDKSFNSGLPQFSGVIGHMMPGDVYSISAPSTDATQFAWITVYEIDQ